MSPPRTIAAADLTLGQTYRDALGNYCEVKSVASTRAHVVVTTNRGRFVFPKSQEVMLA